MRKRIKESLLIRLCRLSVITLGLFCALATSAVGAEYKKADFFPVSVWYSGGKARAPMLSQIDENSETEWRADLRQIKSLGFNTVRTWVEWAHCEPAPGQYNFENLELLCRLANEMDLRVIVQIYVDSAPDWVGMKYEDALFEAQDGSKVHPQSAPGYCTDHAEVRELVLNFYEAAAKAAVTYPNLYGWDLWSEPHIVNWAYINYVPNVQFCYCPHTQSRFRLWLQNKYGTLRALNNAWYRNFDTWGDVQPPRFGTILSYTDFIDWKNFIYQRLAEDLKARYDAIRRIDGEHVITSHAAVPSIFYSPYNGYGATDDFLMAGSVDHYGTSLYPKHNHPDRHWEAWKFALAVDFTRSANRKNNGFYVGELQAGTGTIGLMIGDPVTPGDHRVWMWSALAKGARAINIYAWYPMSSGYESGGYGLIGLDGRLTKRAKAAGKTAQLIHENRTLFLDARPIPADVAIVYNPLAQMVGGEQRHSTGDMHYLSLTGYYRYFLENNVPVDFIHRTDLETDDLSKYKLIIVPYPLMVTHAAAEGLKEYVRNGGHALAEARLAWNDERGFAAEVIPGMGLSKVFGVREKHIKMQERPAMFALPDTHPLNADLDTIRGAYFAQSLEPTDKMRSTVIAEWEDASPAIVLSPYGEGKTLCAGSFLGLANQRYALAANERFLSNVLEWAEVNRHFTSSHDGVGTAPVEIRGCVHSSGSLLYIINHDQNSQRVTVDFSVDRTGIFKLTDLMRHVQRVQKSDDDMLQIETELEGRDVAIWDIRERIDKIVE